MATFICPNCDKRSEIKENGDYETIHVCPHCGQAFKVNNEMNIIVEE